MDTAFGIILIIAAIALVILVLLQGGKDKGLSGAISGGASDTYLGRNGAGTKEKRLAKLTLIVAIIFAVIVLIAFVIQKDEDFDALKDAVTATDTVESEDTSNDSTDTTVADSSTTAADGTNAGDETTAADGTTAGDVTTAGDETTAA